MATGQGSRQQFLMVDETEYGTTPTTPSMFKMPIADSGIGGEIFKQGLLSNPEITGNRNPSAPVLGNRSVAYDLPVPLHLDAIGYLLKHAVGEPASSGSDPYTHISKVGFDEAVVGILPIGFSGEVGFTDIDVFAVLTGCKVNTMRINATSEGVAVFEFGIIGNDFGTPSGSSEDAAPTEFTSDAIGHFAGTIEEGGSPSAIITAVDLTLNNALDPSLYVVGGAGTFPELPEGKASVTGSVTALFQNLTLLNKAINGDESSLQLSWVDSTHSLTIDIPELRYEPNAPTASGDKGVLVTLPFQAYYGDHADATILKSTLVNDVSSYA